MKGSFLHCPFLPPIPVSNRFTKSAGRIFMFLKTGLDLSIVLYPADRTAERTTRTPKKTCLNDMPLIWCFSVKPLNCFFQTVSIKYSQSAPMHHHHLHHQSLGFFFFFTKRASLTEAIFYTVLSSPLSFCIRSRRSDWSWMVQVSGEWFVFFFKDWWTTCMENFCFYFNLFIGCIFRLLLKWKLWSQQCRRTAVGMSVRINWALYDTSRQYVCH